MSEASREHELLRARARALAQPAPTLGLGDNATELLVFTRAGTSYAIEVRFVRELLPLSEYTAVPYAPPGCMGLVAARSELFALFDLAALAAPTAETSTPGLMLVCGEPARELALAVDEALELVPRAALQRSPDDRDGPFLGLDERGYLVLDGEALLDDPRLSIDPKQPETESPP